MQPLFDAELNYQDGLKPIVAEEGREGDLIGSGTGHVTGREIAGTIRWSMFAANCPYRADGRNYPELDVPRPAITSARPIREQ